ncbi:hypothetical protein Q9L58_005527 [Maublancomyces gigas]|uniref:Putative gamma-glutamylcyclotransferase n=1 Tax=Discina gigas TaxID=1032678 RepID=A0ABR3GHR5_9PEZI
MTQQTSTPVAGDLVTLPPAPRTPYFVYGSLMSSNILFSIITPYGSDFCTPSTAKLLRQNQMVRATLYKHKRHAVVWAEFPAIRRTDNPEDFVEGYLVTGLTAQQESNIAAFESGLYRDEGVEVVMGWGKKTSGESKKARVYVWNGTSAELMDPAVGDWTFSKFKESNMYKMRFRGCAGPSDDEED